MKVGFKFLAVVFAGIFGFGGNTHIFERADNRFINEVLVGECGEVFEDEQNKSEYDNEEPQTPSFIKWAQFDIPYDALDRGYKQTIAAYKKEREFDWIELFSLLAVKYYGNWGSYRSKDLEQMASDMLGKGVADKLYVHKNYQYYYEVYSAVLGGFIGGEGEDFGLQVYSPIAAGWRYRHCDDFGNARGYGFKRRHLGHDMMGSVGTPIIAVESGYIEELGWNQYGGWRIGIRSHDKKRYYYYAHLRKGHPFVDGLEKGDNVEAGEHIGYMGMTGYSVKPDTNNIKTPHLHFGIQLIFDESQKDALCELWIDCFNIVRFLARHKRAI